MKTIDKVMVFWFEGLYEAFLNENGEQSDSEENAKMFEEELRRRNFVWSEESGVVIAYEIEELFGYYAAPFMERIEFWQEGGQIKIDTVYDEYSGIYVSWDKVYEELKQHEHLTDTYFKQDVVDALLTGEVEYGVFVDNVVNQFAIDYIKAFVLEDIKNRVNSMTSSTLKWG